MKTGLIAVAAVASVLMLSGAAMAGGENCASKKGAHKDLSASSSHGADHQSWVQPQNSANAEQPTATPSAAAGNDVVQDAPAKPVKGVLNI